MVNQMPQAEAEFEARVDAAFTALADPTRRQLVARLAQRDGLTVNDLARPLAHRMSLPAVSKHLRILEKAGLLTQEKRGRQRLCHLTPDPLNDVVRWITFHKQFWTPRLDSLAQHLESQPPKKAIKETPDA